MKKLITLILSASLTACGGGGGGTSAPSTGTNIYGCTDTLANNYNSSATVDDGSCAYNGGGVGASGNASYYGFTTSGAEITDDLSAPASANHIVVPSELYVEINSRANRTLTATVYQPTCPMGTAVHYSALLLTDSTGANAVSVYINTFANIARVTNHSFRIASRQRYDYSVGPDLSFTCANGKITVSDGTLIYANSKTLIMKKGSNLYMGFAQSTLAITTPSSLTFNYDSYNHASIGSCSLYGCSFPGGAGSSYGGGDQGLSTSDYVSTGKLYGYFTEVSGNNAYRYSNAESMDSSHAVVESAFATMTALVASYGGQRVFLGTLSSHNNFNNGGPCNTYGQDSGAEYCTGSAGLTIGVEP